MVKTSTISPPASRDGFDRLQRRTAGRGDVLDDHDALALQALALGEAFHGEPGAVLLGFLADEKGRDRVALDPGQLRDRARQRDRAHFQPADEIEVVVLQRLIGQLRQQRRAFGIEHGRLEVEVEIALAARSQRDLAAAERTLADDLGEASTGGRFGQGGFPKRLRRAAMYRWFPAHSSADPAPSTGHGVPPERRDGIRKGPL